MRRALLLALVPPVLLALVQQQLLLRQPPRLASLRQAPASSGPAALEVRFSRPIPPASLQRASRLTPPLPHRWLGQGSNLLLSLAPGVRITAPLQVLLAGRDPRGLALPPSRWRWDPRPRVLAVVQVKGGEQLQLRRHDGRWQAISPVWPAIPLLQPLGDGSGVAAASRRADGQLQLWRLPIRQRPLRPWGPPAGGRRAEAGARAQSAAEIAAEVAVGIPQPLRRDAVVFAHFSSNRRGDLLVQSGGLEPGSSSTALHRGGGSPQPLPWRASGPMQLTPEGGAVLVPDGDGLHLQSLPPRPPRRQSLPGSRDLSSFCPQAGRAVLLRHWPDFRRSLELVEPGQPPRQLWLGGEALLASACSRGGDRLWALLQDTRRPQLSLVRFDGRGRQLARRLLADWEAEPGTGLHWDPSSGQLLAVLRPIASVSGRRQPARAVLIDGASLGLRPLAPAVSQALWLPAG